MKRLLAVLFSVNLAFGYPWTGYLDSTRAIDWSQVGAGTIPSPTKCGSTISAYTGTAATINTAITNAANGTTCSATANDPKYVELGAGSFNLSTNVLLNKSYVTLRGAGPDQTTITGTAGSGCHLTVAVCIAGGTNIDGSIAENIASWTAGYSQGATSITIGANTTGSTKPAVGWILLLDQLEDGSLFSQDTWPSIFSCFHGGSTGCVVGTSSIVFSGRPVARGQQQAVIVTSISAGSCPCTVGITPGLYMPNWRSGQTPQAWWSNSAPVTQVGIENLALSQSQIGALFATYSWIKNVKIDYGPASDTGRIIHFYLSVNNTVRDSYIFGPSPGVDPYAVDVIASCNTLIENNILQHTRTQIIHEQGCASVIGYNYIVNNTNPGGFMQLGITNHGSSAYYWLSEGNDVFGFGYDNFWAGSDFLTQFRNRAWGYDTVQAQQQTTPGFAYNLYRFTNWIGNVMGTVSYHQHYQRVPGDGHDYNYCNTSIYALGLGGNCGDGGASGFPPNDSHVLDSIYRWGNWDVVTNAIRWCGGSGNTGWSTTCGSVPEVPNGLTNYSQTIPSTETLPASFYLASKPAWFGSHVYPPIGPDVTGGDLANSGGHAYRIPARICFEDVMGGAITDTSPKTFNANSCYASGSGTGGSLGGGRTLSGGRASNN